MSKLEKIILIKDDEVRILEGEEAERWDHYLGSLLVLGSVHGIAPDFSKFNWQVFKKVPEEK